MTQKRIYYPVHSAALSECGVNTYTAIHGLQSFGRNTRFSTEPTFEIGQSEVYDLQENLPSVEITLEKVLDGYPLIYHLATPQATTSSLQGRSNARCTLGWAVFSDVQDSASGTPLARAVASGMYVSALNYAFQVQGNSTESVTLVGNNLQWNNAFTISSFDNADEPLAIAGSGGVNRREDVLLGADASVWPLNIPGVSASGTIEREATGTEYRVHLQSVRISTNLGREELLELGRKGPYHRYASFPVEVRCDIEFLSQSGEFTQALEDADNLVNQTIKVMNREGTTIELGTKNKLSAVTFGGADAGQQGGNASCTMSFTNFNHLVCTHPQDPAGL